MGTYTGKVESIAAGGDGILRMDGMVVFIPLTAPGDVVAFTVKSRHRDWMQGELVQVLEPGPDRVEPLCPYYGRCGGCNLQHLSAEAQLRERKNLLSAAFRGAGDFLPGGITVHELPQWEYRCRARFSREGELLGHKAAGSGETIDIKDCPVMVKDIRAFLGDKRYEETGYPGPYCVFSWGDTFLTGKQNGRVSILDKSMRLRANVFFQSNIPGLEAMIKRLREVAETADRTRPMADIYSGVGVFALFLADLFPRVDLLEGFPIPAHIAYRNMAEHRKAGREARFFCMRDEDFGRHYLAGTPVPGDKPPSMADGSTIRGFANASQAFDQYRHRLSDAVPGGYGFAVVDPPRHGLSPAMRNAFFEKGPPLIAYVSCNFATLARDYCVLCRPDKGSPPGNPPREEGPYRLVSLDFFDFYPQTAHVESLAVFERIEAV